MSPMQRPGEPVALPVRESGRVQIRCQHCGWHIVNIRVQGSADIDKTCPNCKRDNAWTVQEPKAA